MLNNYLSKLPESHRNNIINKSLEDNNFRYLLNNCYKLNIFLFEKNDNKFISIKHNLLLKKINELKLLYIKNYGMKILKFYSKDLDTARGNINEYHKKFNTKMEVIDDILNFLNIFDNNTLDRLLEDSNKIKINYSNNIEIIDFDSSLFISSDDFDSDKSSNIVLTYNLNDNNAYIAEFSN